MHIRKSHVISGALALLLVGATATAWYYASQARTPEQIAEDTEPPDDSIITVAVEEGQLLDEFVVAGIAQRTGDIAINVAAGDAAEGEVAITSDLPLEVGDDVDNGTVLMEVSGRPLIALEGDIPAYRDLIEGESEGPDVEQLQEALQGIYGTPVTGRFDERTASDIRQLYDGRGYSAPTTTPGGPPNMGDGHDDGITPEESSGDVTTLPASEVAFVPEFPVQVGEIEANLAAPLPEDGEAMVLVGGTWQVEAELTEEELQDLRALDDDAELIYGAGPLQDGEISGFELEERENEGDEFSEGTVDNFAVFEFDDEDLENATPGESQSVRVIRARSDENALTAPLSAVWTNSDDKTLVTVRESADDERHVEVDVILQHEGTGVLEPVDGELAAGDDVIIAFRDRGN